MIRFMKNLFKRQVQIQYLPMQPRYEALGYMHGDIYFINAGSGKVYRLTRCVVSDYEIVTHVCTLADR